MRVPLILASAAAVCLWGVAIAGLAAELDDRVTSVTAAGAASLTVVSASAWLMFGIAFMVRDQGKARDPGGELLFDGIVAEVRKRAAKDQDARPRPRLVR
jgi:hypothetical protein